MSQPHSVIGKLKSISMPMKYRGRALNVIEKLRVRRIIKFNIMIKANFFPASLVDLCPKCFCNELGTQTYAKHRYVLSDRFNYEIEFFLKVWKVIVCTLWRTKNHYGTRIYSRNPFSFCQDRADIKSV